ncbi:OmpH family outer membrane protein [Flavobacterium sp. I-SCBP12n]|uniref:OmpH family outer membrane protein n=2 Tax=Flavobacterium TaxID=237 RepID=A0A9X1XT55_9FLAO|nr:MULTISPECIES: OmpH family outer membrane protein [Flavobacterium]MBP4140739.1 OmpH family outer membrane protein [Flavobacterium flabelliforme]MCK8142146.1 OmpH family outer membrane protein [Flavobacterium pygoscelis]
MKKQFLSVFLALITYSGVNAQAKGTKLGFIDMEYILENVSDYTEAKNQLDQKANKWKLEIETKKIEINKLKEALKAEKVLLTKELIEERETEIAFLENQNLEYQLKRFGPNGDLMIQKSTLVKPIQDQVFTAVQDIAERLKYDFIFDKSSDLTMLFAAKRFDISEQVLRVLNRTEKREQLTKKQQKEAEIKESKEDALDDNPDLAERKKLIEEKKTAREQILEERKLLQEQKKQEFEDKRKQIQAEREAKKAGTVSANIKEDNAVTTPKNVETKKESLEESKQKENDARLKILEDRKKVIEDRKKELDEKRKKTIEEREALKKAKEEKTKENTNNN